MQQLVTTVSVAGQEVDRLSTYFGIRTGGPASTRPTTFLLNGRHYEIHGTCNHQDAAGVG